MIVTKPSTGTYPWLASVTPSTIVIAPGDQYILDNNTNIYRFPFDSPTSYPLITNWRRVTAPTTPGGNAIITNVTSQTAWTLGNGQFFDYVSFVVNDGTQDGGNIGESSFWVSANPLINMTYNWQAEYDLFVNGNTIINTVVFFDI